MQPTQSHAKDLMTDSLTPEKRSWNMSRIRGKDTSVEVKVRKYLFNKGFRYRKNVNSLPGKPDIVLPKYHAVVFVHGCFWHRHPECKDATFPKTRTDFWHHKFEQNVRNDARHKVDLEKLGWRVFVVWECEIEKSFDETMSSLVCKIREI